MRNLVAHWIICKMFIGCQDSRTARDMVLRIAIYGYERISYMAQTQQEGARTGSEKGRHITVQISSKILSRRCCRRNHTRHHFGQLCAYMNAVVYIGCVSAIVLSSSQGCHFVG